MSVKIKSPLKHNEGGHSLLEKEAHIAEHGGDVVEAGYETSYSYSPPKQAKHTHKENLKDLDERKKYLDKRDIKYTSDLDASKKYFKHAKSDYTIPRSELDQIVGQGDIDVAGGDEVYDPKKHTEEYIKRKSESGEFILPDNLSDGDYFDEKGMFKPISSYVVNNDKLSKEQYNTLNYFLEKGDGRTSNVKYDYR